MSSNTQGAPKAPKPRSLTSLRNEADALASRVARARGRCSAKGHVGADGLALRCSARLEWAHLKSRGVMFLRFDPLNSVCLCSAHHRHFTHHPDLWTDFVHETRPGVWDRLNEAIRERRATPRPLPLRTIFAEAIERLRGMT